MLGSKVNDDCTTLKSDWEVILVDPTITSIKGDSGTIDAVDVPTFKGFDDELFAVRATANLEDPTTLLDVVLEANVITYLEFIDAWFHFLLHSSVDVTIIGEIPYNVKWSLH